MVEKKGVVDISLDRSDDSPKYTFSQNSPTAVDGAQSQSEQEEEKSPFINMKELKKKARKADTLVDTLLVLGPNEKTMTKIIEDSIKYFPDDFDSVKVYNSLQDP